MKASRHKLSVSDPHTTYSNLSSHSHTLTLAAVALARISWSASYSALLVAASMGMLSDHMRSSLSEYLVHRRQ